MTPARFNFPPLGPTGEGEVQHVGRQGDLFWQPDDESWDHYVTLQHDRPAVAFRCHEPGRSSPCDRETAERFIQWVQKQERQ